MLIKPGTEWAQTYDRCMAETPEAFTSGGTANLVHGRWQTDGTATHHLSPIDGSRLEGPFQLSRVQVEQAVMSSIDQHTTWSRVPLEERRALVAHAVDALEEQRDLLALLLVWEIGKTWASACADVDRALSGVRWYLEEIERQSHNRLPLTGPVSNVASWNYPMSVLIHSELVQLLAGNAVIAKTPSKGGFHALTLAHALMHRAGLPVTLVSGPGAALGKALINNPDIGAFAYVGGRENVRKIKPILTRMARAGQRHILEQEGLNTWGVWDFSQWDVLQAFLVKGFEYGKQRCTAYPRYVVQRALFPEFLQCYQKAVEGLVIGNPLAVTSADDPLPSLDFGPLISAGKVGELTAHFQDGLRLGGVPLVDHSLDDSLFIPGQDSSAYLAPKALLGPPSQWALHQREPFGPLDSVVLVDTEEEMLRAMNVSNGALVASIATDDPDVARRLVDQVQAFKIGVNRPRSRGDREEIFGGKGASWDGAFVGGDLLVEAVTRQTEDLPGRLYGNFTGYSSFPPAEKDELQLVAG